MWDPPRPGLEPVSPALAGRPSTTAPPGKPLLIVFIKTRMPSTCHVAQGSPAFLAPGTGFVEDGFSTGGAVGTVGSGGHESDGGRWGAAEEASLAIWLLTSCEAGGLGTPDVA